MRDHDVYVIKYTERVASGVWHAHDDLEITGYGEPQEFESYYVASSKEIAEAHWRYWSRHTDRKRKRTFVSAEKLAHAIVILELR